MVLGSGGRERSVSEKFAKSPYVEKVYFVPGNSGVEPNPKIEERKISFENIEEILALLKDYKKDLIFIGPEKPLVDGIKDKLIGKGFNRIIGPEKNLAKLEGSKIYAYEKCLDLKIPQATSIIMKSGLDLKGSIEKNKKIFENGVVVKKDGLCEGKGVKVYQNIEDAIKDGSDFLKKSYTKQDYLLAEKLCGFERSLFGIGHNGYFCLVPGIFLDHKPVFDNNLGPNTGGMGAYGPVKLDDYSIKDLGNIFLKPIFDKGYSGILYAGLMITKEGPKLIEYNVRGGDPEFQLIMALMENDFYDFCDSLLKNKKPKIEFKNNYKAVDIVLASKNYPEKFEIGTPIKGLKKAIKSFGVKIFSGSTKLNDKEELITNGGRVLHICAVGENEEDIKKRAYGAVEIIVKNTKLNTFHYRCDIPYLKQKN